MGARGRFGQAGLCRTRHAGRPSALAVLFSVALLTSAACGPAAEGTPSAEPVSDSEAGPEADSELQRLRADLDAAEREVERLRTEQEQDPEHSVLRNRVTTLQLELAREQEQRLERELEWLRYTRALAGLELESIPEDLEFVPEVPEELAELADLDAPELPGDELSDPEPRDDREAEIQRTLVSLLTIEEVHALTLLDVGELGEGWIGPILFRINDARGYLAGSLYAERFYLEASRAARTLTLVLEEGHETRGGVRTPFMRASPLQPGTRRIVLPYLDPAPWAESLPELFEGHPLDELHDDGKWDLTLVRGTLNLLLREDGAEGWYRLRTLGGVTGDVLRDVHLLELDREGNTRRHLFADRLKVSIQEKGVLVELEDGASMKGQEKIPFVEGRLLLYLPRAEHRQWICDEVPLFERGPAEESGETPPETAPESGAPASAGQ